VPAVDHPAPHEVNPVTRLRAIADREKPLLHLVLQVGLQVVAEVPESLLGLLALRVVGEEKPVLGVGAQVHDPVVA